MKFKIIKDNKEIECDIIMTFSDNTNDINYIVYTDGTKDEDGELLLYASRFRIENDEYKLYPIEQDFEWNLIDNMLESKYKEN